MLVYWGLGWYLLVVVLFGGGVSLYGVSLHARCPFVRDNLTDNCSLELQSALHQANLIFGGAHTRSFMSLSYAPCTYTQSPLSRLSQRIIHWIYVKSRPLIE